MCDFEAGENDRENLEWPSPFPDSLWLVNVICESECDLLILIERKPEQKKKFTKI